MIDHLDPVLGSIIALDGHFCLQGHSFTLYLWNVKKKKGVFMASSLTTNRLLIVTNHTNEISYLAINY